MRGPGRALLAAAQPAPGLLARHRVAAGFIVGGAFAIVAGGFWLAAPPAATPAAISVASQTHQVSVVLNALEGCSTATATVTDAAGRPLRAASVEVQAVMPLMGLAMPATTSTTSTTGAITTPVCLAITGPWQLRFTVQALVPDALVVPVDVTG